MQLHLNLALVYKIGNPNGLTSDLIFVGQRLKVSGTAASNSGSPSVEVKTDVKNVQTSAPAAKTGASVDTLINEAKKLIGVPYKWGGTTPLVLTSVDLFTMYINKRAMISHVPLHKVTLIVPSMWTRHKLGILYSLKIHISYEKRPVYGLNMISSFTLFFFYKSLISSADIPSSKASLI